MLDLADKYSVVISMQLGIGFVFLHSVLGKLRRPSDFADGIIDYQILPASLVWPFAVIVIACEAAIVAAHLAGWKLGMLIPVSIVLLCVFLVAVLLVIRRGTIVSCSCFGGDQIEAVSWRSFFQLVALIVAETVLLLHVGTNSSDMFVFHQPIEQVLNSAITGAVGVLAAMWMLHMPELVALTRSCRRCGGDRNGAPRSI